MKKYKPEDGKWQVGPKATEIRRLKRELPDDQYSENKKALQKYLCSYFSTGKCDSAQGCSISPLGATKKGGKVLKVRWAYPGCGKSGSMRLVVVAYCKTKRVHITGAFPRRDDPKDEEIWDTVKGY